MGRREDTHNDSQPGGISALQEVQTKDGSAPARGRWDLGKASQKRHLDQAIKVDNDKWGLHGAGRERSLFQHGKVKMETVIGGGT